MKQYERDLVRRPCVACLREMIELKQLKRYKDVLERILLTAEFHTQYGVKDELRLEALRVVMTEAGYVLNQEKDDD